MVIKNLYLQAFGFDFIYKKNFILQTYVTIVLPNSELLYWRHLEAFPNSIWNNLAMTERIFSNSYANKFLIIKVHPAFFELAMQSATHFRAKTSKQPFEVRNCTIIKVFNCSSIRRSRFGSRSSNDHLIYILISISKQLHHSLNKVL